MIDKHTEGKAGDEQGKEREQEQEQQLATDICDKKVVTNLSTDRQRKLESKTETAKQREKERGSESKHNVHVSIR